MDEDPKDEVVQSTTSRFVRTLVGMVAGFIASTIAESVYDKIVENRLRNAPVVELDEPEDN